MTSCSTSKFKEARTPETLPIVHCPTHLQSRCKYSPAISWTQLPCNLNDLPSRNIHADTNPW